MCSVKKLGTGCSKMVVSKSKGSTIRTGLCMDVAKQLLQTENIVQFMCNTKLLCALPKKSLALSAFCNFGEGYWPQAKQ